MAPSGFRRAATLPALALMGTIRITTAGGAAASATALTVIP